MIQILPITDLRTRTTDYLEQVKKNHRRDKAWTSLRGTS